jgi:hypothetical protein
LFYSDKEAIEIEFGGALEWNELPDGKESYVTVTKEKADFRNENDWTLDGDAQHTMLLTSDVLRGVQRWVERHPHRVFMKNAYTNALRTYRIADEYVCDIGIASDL